MRGSWDELVDTAIDSGLVVEPHLTRQEVAWALASQWTPKKSESDEEGDAKTRKARKRSAADVRVPGWSLFSGAVPRAVTVARRADVADFASHGASRDRARDAWVQVGELRAQVAKRSGFFARVRRALSLRSLRMRRKLRLSASIARTMHEEKKQ